MNNKQSPAEDQKTPKKKKRSKAARNILLVVQVIFVMVFMGVLAAGGAAAGFVASVVKDQKVITYEEMKEKIYTNYLTGFAYFRDGQQIGKLPAEQDRRLVNNNEISKDIVNALISTEDKDFYNHKGVSFRATMRATLQQITGNDFQTGGSTITQQLVKNTLLEEDFHRELSGELKGKELKLAKYNRKLSEIFLALRLERYFTKPQILEAYLNEIYFGQGANGSNLYGIQAASKGIFGLNAKDLNLAQSAYIVGVIQNPGGYSPFKKKGLENGLKRMKFVLGEMLEDGKITEQQYNEALAFDIEGSLVKKEEINNAYDKYPFLVTEALEKATQVLVKENLAKSGIKVEDLSSDEYKSLYSSTQRDILSKGYKIYTTIDKELYEAFQAFAANPENFWPNQTYTIQVGNEKKEITDAPQQLGAVLIENKTGAILANIAGRDFKIEQTNHATVPRQPGSAMKPIAAYGPALEEGILLGPESPIDDSPIVLNKGTQWEHVPENWNGNFQGIMSTREALKMSWNIPAIRAYLEVGIPTALEYVKKMGVTTLTESDYKAQTGVIGGLAEGLTVEEITNAYATFPNAGTFVDAYMIERIENNDGEVIYEHKIKAEPVFSEQTAYMITDMLETVYRQGTGRQVLGYFSKENKDYAKVRIGGKTGTTQNVRDLWFVGFTPNLSLGVWTGFDQPYSMEKDQLRAKYIWGNLLKEVYDRNPELSPIELTFEKPDGLVQLSICSKSGMLPSDLCKEAGYVITGLFKKENVPTEIDDKLVKGRAVILNEKIYVANEQTPDDMVISKIFIKREPLDLPSPEKMEQMKKPLSWYLPNDWMDTLPTEADPRTEDGQIPSTPTGFNVTYNAGEKKAVLKWNANPEADIVGYRIYRSTDFGFDKIASVLSHQPKEFVDANISNLNTGYFITAVDIAGNESMATEPKGVSGNNSWTSAKPSTPTGAQAKKGTVGIEITWNENPEREQVQRYDIYHSATKDGNYEYLGSNSVAYYQHLTFGEDPGWYKIVAYNHVGNSEPTAPFTASEPSEDQGGEPADPNNDTQTGGTNENNGTDGNSETTDSEDTDTSGDTNDNNIINLPGLP